MKRSSIVKIFLAVLVVLFFVALAVVAWEIYVPKSLAASPVIPYAIQKGMGEEDIAFQLEAGGIIKSSFFFNLYVVATGQHSKLQAGKYTISLSMSIDTIVKKFVSGDVVKEKIVLFEGWNAKAMGQYLESQDLYHKKDFLDAAKKNFSREFLFLRSKPKDLSLEGYLFPDTYYVNDGESVDDFLRQMLYNFDRKLTPDLKIEIAAQHKTIFQIITMASIIEKEVRSPQDKKIVSGILWKRIANNIPLQVDSTVNYATGRSDARVAVKDTFIDSPYNTYKYKGLPLGPISNPGLDSILAAMYPKKTDYWYYLSADGSSKTIFSKTFEEHAAAAAKYFR